MKRLACFPRKILLFGYFVDPSDLVPTPKHREGGLRLLWVGRMLDLKKVDTLIKAVGTLICEGRDVRLTLVGYGQEEQKLKKLAETINNGQWAMGKGQGGEVLKCESSKVRKLETANVANRANGEISRQDAKTQSAIEPLNQAAGRLNLGESGRRPIEPEFPTHELPPITFLPPVPIAEVRALMRQSDVYVLPSNGYEGWGVVVNEAMLEGCAVVASRETGAAATLVRDGVNGMLFPSGDVGQLTQVLRRLESDEVLRLRLAETGQHMMLLEWTPAVAAERLIAFSECVLAGLEPPRWGRGPLSSF